MDVLQQGYSGAGGVGDDRKRSYESGEEAPTGIGGQPKRSRPGKLVPFHYEYCRLLC